MAISWVCVLFITVYFARPIFFKPPAHPNLHLVQIGKNVRKNGPPLSNKVQKNPIPKLFTVLSQYSEV